MSDQAKKVLSDAMALSESEREHLAELLLTSLPRLSKREQAEIEKAWADEGRLASRGAFRLLPSHPRTSAIWSTDDAAIS